MVLTSIMKKLGDAQAAKGTGSLSSMFSKAPAQAEATPAAKEPEVDAAARDEDAGTDRARSPSEVWAEQLPAVRSHSVQICRMSTLDTVCALLDLRWWCLVEQGSEPAGSAEPPSRQEGAEEEDVPSRAEEDAVMHDAAPTEGDVPAEEAGSAPDSPVQTLRRVRRVEADASDQEEVAEREEVDETQVLVAGDASRYRQEVAVAGDQGQPPAPPTPRLLHFARLSAHHGCHCAPTSEAWCSVCGAAP